MKAPSQRIRRALWLSAAAATAAALVVPAVTSSAAAQPAAPSGTSMRGGGYPPPGGIYTGMTGCPLKNQLMHETTGTDSAGFAACVLGLAPSGSITIGTITTPVTEPVNVQFGFASGPPGPGDTASFPLPAYPPPAGESAITQTKPDLIPESLTTALGCSTATDPTIQQMCQVAQDRGGRYNQVFALAQDAGNIQNFNLFTWTQPMKFQLINPLLGNNCYIGTDSDPVVLHPALSISSLSFEQDPAEAANQDLGVLASVATASDTTFSAPGVIGCGPGGLDNRAVDEQLDTTSGLPAASGNSLTLNGNFNIALDESFSGFPVAFPDYANGLLAAFKASTNGEHSVKHQITMSQMKGLFHHS